VAGIGFPQQKRIKTAARPRISRAKRASANERPMRNPAVGGDGNGALQRRP
jgi:hypothetical protein